MKKLFFLTIALLFISFVTEAQISVFNARDVHGTYVVDVEFHVDSGATIGAWDKTGFYPYMYDGVDFSTYPIGVTYLNEDSTDITAGDTCLVTAYVKGIAKSTQTDIPVDTIFTSDSSNTLSFTTLDFNSKAMLGYWIQITNTGHSADGWMQLVFRKVETFYIPRIY